MKSNKKLCGYIFMCVYVNLRVIVCVCVSVYVKKRYFLRGACALYDVCVCVRESERECESVWESEREGGGRPQARV